MGIFGWDDSNDAYQQYQNGGGQEHEGSKLHEFVGGAAAFEGFKLFEDHQRAEGKQVNHAFAKELVAGFAGAEAEKFAETRGLNEYDKIQARRHAEDSAQNMYSEHYEQNLGADQYDPQQYGGHDYIQNNYNNY
ncbi:hypothetical protein L228DRAFT_285119 [Xylona heveae TC161]|uniref:CipC-like antibiotic response protein n=1 Tax=Xylona heveae (strain CBS 132557 / TC161) TaxID=1328760 RepID=A0A165AFY5_XYLHT|nr:hypothetical protein L228DRAFT_285119 [Xylona heveae TC161]KZF20411.1 hypothetical protein L228DRAFT_285119 [Xylona heveae TC161]